VPYSHFIPPPLAPRPPQIVPDGEVGVSLERIETHLVSLLASINQRTNPAAPPLGPRALARAAEAKAAEAAANAVERGEDEVLEIGDAPAAADPSAVLVPQPPPYPKPVKSGGAGSSSSEARFLQSMGASRGGNNVRVFTYEEVERVLDDLPEEEPEGVDDEGNELNLTRRQRKTSGEPSPRRGSGGKPPSKGNAVASKGRTSGGGRSSAPGQAPYA